MWKITFTFKGFIAGIFYNRAETEADAIDYAKMHCASRYDKIRAERLGDVA